MKMLTKTLATVFAITALIAGPGVTAYALTQVITGQTPVPGRLENYTTARNHAQTGTLSMSMRTVALCGGSTALSLRNGIGTPFTTSPTWTSPTGTKYFGLATSGSQLIPKGVFYVSARMTGRCYIPDSERFFSGTLSF
ncbi:hypothetical protein N1031_07355 [Herbiconiux moechotypicola]|uniref:Uncharacterized protein n=1 Tax=Herbiconiux moechotypicola TaxID=637393 RepID=A0ABN3DHJ5_9MICO|nr:hypothetical protein [Herbiconiux moechotypicola]MCS5729574.1 hypothetical protein [Herbiconiux moechotypicola]